MVNAVTQENEQPGTLEWQLSRLRLRRGVLRCAEIEGYASKTSVYPGDTIDFMVSTEPASLFTIDIYRLGYYGGTGGRHIQHLGPFEGKTQPVPMESIERMRECKWQPCTSLTIPGDWVSGVYLAKLNRDRPITAQSYIIFIVKERRKSDILVQVSDLTWQAYNKWPKANSLYDDGLGTGIGYSYVGPNVRVSFDRPYAKYDQTVDQPLSLGSGMYFVTEFPLTYWLEAEGYDVTYCSNLDLHANPQLLEQCSVFLSVGHDEYWSPDMYTNAMAGRDAGTSLLFLSGNALAWEIIPYNSSNSKEPFRSFARRGRLDNEQELMGVTSYGPGYGDWTVTKPDHWVFDGTGMKKGDCIPGLVGWEYHAAPFKEDDKLEVLAQSELHFKSPTRKGNPRENDGSYASVIYPGPHGNWVFSASTIWWVQGLSNPPGHMPGKATYGRTQGVDVRVQQITRNLLNKCIGKKGE